MPPRVWVRITLLISQNVAMKALGVFLVGLAAEVALILSNPIIFGSDNVNRLLHRDELVMGHQMPPWDPPMYVTSTGQQGFRR